MTIYEKIGFTTFIIVVLFALGMIYIIQKDNVALNYRKLQIMEDNYKLNCNLK